MIGLSVMKKKLSQKERNETVTKGFLVDYLEKQEYITRPVLEEILESKNYVTKDWAQDMFETLLREFQNHTSALAESFRHENSLIIEALTHRIERIENHIGLPYP
jgi:hypothetical protein